MKWHDHIRIAVKAARDFGLDGPLIEILKSAVILPDQQRHKHERHHTGKDPETMLRIWKARNAVLRGDKSAAALELGQALHYIHDKCVYVGPEHSHDSIEEEISSLDFPQNAIENGRKRGVCSYRCAEECVSHTTPKDDAASALWEATEHSRMLITAVFGNIHISNVLLKRMKIQKWLYLLLGMCLSITSLIGLPIILVAFARWPLFPSVLLGVACSILAAKPFQKFSDLRLECKWFVAGSSSQPKLF